MEGLIYPELSYKIVGLCFEVYNNLGYGYHEKYYQKAFAELLETNKITYKKELMHSIKFKDKIIGRYFMDFMVDGKVVVEFKVADDFYQLHINQVLAYLKSVSLKLGILVLFTKNGIKYKRLVNLVIY